MVILYIKDKVVFLGCEFTIRYLYHFSIVLNEKNLTVTGIRKKVGLRFLVSKPQDLFWVLIN
jgi:hypothetical protein